MDKVTVEIGRWELVNVFLDLLEWIVRKESVQPGKRGLIIPARTMLRTLISRNVQIWAIAIVYLDYVNADLVSPVQLAIL